MSRFCRQGYILMAGQVGLLEDLHIIPSGNWSSWEKEKKKTHPGQVRSAAAARMEPSCPVGAQAQASSPGTRQLWLCWRQHRTQQGAWILFQRLQPVRDASYHSRPRGFSPRELTALAPFPLPYLTCFPPRSVPAATPRRALLPSLWGKMEEGLPWGKQGLWAPQPGAGPRGPVKRASLVCPRVGFSGLQGIGEPEAGSEEAPKRSRAGLPGRSLTGGLSGEALGPCSPPQH